MQKGGETKVAKKQGEKKGKTRKTTKRKKQKMKKMKEERRRLHADWRLEAPKLCNPDIEEWF